MCPYFQCKYLCTCLSVRLSFQWTFCGPIFRFVKQNGDRRDFREIGLIEVLWKTITVLLNWRFILEIGFHDVLNGFREGLGTGTAFIEAKLLLDLMDMREAVLHKIFLGF